MEDVWEVVSSHVTCVSAQQRANAVFESHAAEGKVWLRLTKAVRAGEEITVKYRNAPTLAYTIWQNQRAEGGLYVR